MVLALADGATGLPDLAVLRNQPAMFGPVASEATVWRTFDRVGPCELAGIDTTRRQARARAWAAGAGPAGDTERSAALGKVMSRRCLADRLQLMQPTPSTGSGGVG